MGRRGEKLYLQLKNCKLLLICSTFYLFLPLEKITGIIYKERGVPIDNMTQ